jgi:hypothetical protein
MKTTLERAFDLARSGRFAKLSDLIQTLNREGYLVSQIQEPLLRQQLTELIKAARWDLVPAATSPFTPGNPKDG